MIRRTLNDIRLLIALWIIPKERTWATHAIERELSWNQGHQPGDFFDEPSKGAA